MKFEERQELQRKIERIIYDSGWIKGNPPETTTVQGMAEQIMSLFTSPQLVKCSKCNKEMDYQIMPKVEKDDVLYPFINHKARGSWYCSECGILIYDEESNNRTCC